MNYIIGKILLIVILLNQLFSCDSTIRYNQKKINQENINYTIKNCIKRCICNDTCYFELLTKYIEVPDSVCECVFGFITIDQELLLVNGANIKKVKNPLFKTQKIQIGSKILEVKCSFITSAKCLKKDNIFVFKINGQNNLDPPNEFFGYLADDGQWIHYFYGDQYSIYKEFGSRANLNQHFSENVLSDGKAMVDLLPR